MVGNLQLDNYFLRYKYSLDSQDTNGKKKLYFDHKIFSQD